jgi:hypothetical protein
MEIYMAPVSYQDPDGNVWEVDALIIRPDSPEEGQELELLVNSVRAVDNYGEKVRKALKMVVPFIR